MSSSGAATGGEPRLGGGRSGMGIGCSNGHVWLSIISLISLFMNSSASGLNNFCLMIFNFCVGNLDLGMSILSGQ